jgi:hypothetical protein
VRRDGAVLKVEQLSYNSDFLFGMLHKCLEGSVEAKPMREGFGRERKAPVIAMQDEVKNPYADNREAMATSQLVQMLDLFSEGGVFTSVYVASA